MELFKSQAAIADFAYERTSGDKDQMVAMVAKLLIENPTLIKQHKRDELNIKGQAGYTAYAKVKVREYFKRALNKVPKVDNIAPTPVASKPATCTLASMLNAPFKLGYGTEDFTSRKGDVLTSYEALVKAFGEPSDGDGEKVAMEWNLTDNDGNNYAIYDWKSTSLYDSGLMTVDDLKRMPRFGFHIGSNLDDISKFTDFLTSIL